MNEITKQDVEKILTSLDNIIETSPWGASNFLQAVGQSLKVIRDKFEADMNAIEASDNKAFKASNPSQKSDPLLNMTQVYVGLYSSDGMNLQTWERIIQNLPRQVVSRPIYAMESDVKAMIRTKENKNNEAYVALYVNPSDILVLEKDKIPIDRLGKELLMLLDRAVDLSHVHYFVHRNVRYRFVQGQLIQEAVLEDE